MIRKITWAVFQTVLSMCFLMSAGAQTFTTQHSFTNTPDGAGPQRLVLSGGLLFGTAAYGGTNGNGVIFSVDTNSSQVSILYNFTSAIGSGSAPDNLVVAGNKIYGAAQTGGTNNLGMLYSINTNGTAFTPLYSFDGYPDGNYPKSGLLLNGGTLYGTAYAGGSGSGLTARGTIFKVNTDGTGYATLHSFTNSPDGANPQSELLLANGVLFGTTTFGGTNGNGTVFAINSNGSGYTILHSFTNSPEPVYPNGGLVLSGGTLYGTGSSGGANTNGAVFAINTNGTGFRVLYSFSGFNGNLDGTTPKATLSLSGSNLLGTTVSGGIGNGGTVFMINTNGTGFTVLASFTNNDINGSDLQGGVIRAGNAIWGTTLQSGINNGGTIFDIVMPQITAQPQSVTVTNGNAASFSVNAVDDGAVSYQWYFQTNAPLTGATSATLAFTNVIFGQAGFYAVKVTDAFGSVTSSYALLSVSNLPNFLSFTFNSTSGSPSFVFANTTNSTNRLWASTNLTSSVFWRVIASNVMATNGLWFFTDTNAARTNNARFYRYSTP